MFECTGNFLLLGALITERSLGAFLWGAHGVSEGSMVKSYFWRPVKGGALSATMSILFCAATHSMYSQSDGGESSMRDGNELWELSVLAQEGGQPCCMLRAVSSGLALVFSMFELMRFLEICVFAMLLLGTTI